MLKITHAPEKNYEQCYIIEGDDVDELVIECLTRIRPKSRDSYKEDLRQSLLEKGRAGVDIHSGQKNSYTVIFTKFIK